MVMIEFHVADDFIHLDIDSRNYYCITVRYASLDGNKNILCVWFIWVL